MTEETKDEVTTTETEIQKYLTGGEQTKITPEIQRLADTITGSDLPAKCQQIFQITSGLVKVVDMNLRGKLMDTRTADEILRDGTATGCTDKANVFAAIARAAGIPTMVIETLDVTWLNTEGEGRIKGHAMVKLYDSENKGWTYYDSVRGMASNVLPDNMVIVDIDLDTWSMGIKGWEDRRRILNEFKKKWREKK